MRFDLIHFFDALSLYLQAGYDLSYSWPETHKALVAEMTPTLKEALSPSKAEEGMVHVLTRLCENFPIVCHRMWFSILKELYVNGAGLNEAVAAIGATLRKEHERDLESHFRNLPTKINVLLLIFFLPPTMLLIFAPLLVEILRMMPE